MYVCMYVCIYICMCITMCIYIYIGPQSRYYICTWSLGVKPTDVARDLDVPPLPHPLPVLPSNAGGGGYYGGGYYGGPTGSPGGGDGGGYGGYSPLGPSSSGPTEVPSVCL